MQKLPTQTFIDIHTHTPAHKAGIFSLENILISKQMPGFAPKQPVSAGLHPWFLTPENFAPKTKQLQDLSPTPLLLAIGECGLDRLAKTDFTIQQKAFEKQIEIAQNAQKPLIVHCVKAYPETIALRKKTKAPNAWIFHAFGGNSQIATQILRHEGCYLSFGAELLKNRPKLHKIFSQTPPNRLFLETDESETSIKTIYEKAAQLRKTPVSELKTQIAHNFNRLFATPPPNS